MVLKCDDSCNMQPLCQSGGNGMSFLSLSRDPTMLITGPSAIETVTSRRREIKCASLDDI